MNSIEIDKTYAVYSDANIGNDINSNSDETNRLIHDSGRLQLNTYQAFVSNIMNPMSDLSSLMLVHMTGTGKTISALATATEYVKQYQTTMEHNSVSSIIVLGFTKNIFKKEILSHPEFMFVNMDDAKELKELENHMHESQVIFEKYQQKRKLFTKRLIKRDVRGIYQFYGYRQFANHVINMDDVNKMVQQSSSDGEFDISRLDTKLLKQWIASGKVRINEAYIKSISKSLIICDEVHNLYKLDQLNSYGIAIQCVFDYFKETKDLMYKGTLRSLLLSATPLTNSALEIIPITSLLTGTYFTKQELFDLEEGVEHLTTKGLSMIRGEIANHISYIMDDNPKEYPSSSFNGESIPSIKYLKFVRTKPIGFQMNGYKKINSSDLPVDDKGLCIVKDVILPATKKSPEGTIFSRHMDELENLPMNTLVHKLNDGTYTSEIFKLPKLKEYSCKYAEMVKMCIDMKSTEFGKIFIFHPNVQGSGTDMIISVLRSNGFLEVGDKPLQDSICMKCNNNYKSHKNDHEFSPIYFTFITGSLSKTVIANRLEAFNNDMNTYGEKIKIIIGSRAMRESHTLRACKNIIITHEPSSISEMIQIIGRAVRKHVHDKLPEDMRSVLISILTTDVSSLQVKNQSMNEEQSYHTKVLQYIQINKIERLLYDVSIDYLINFRFKMRETPMLLGETYPLDMKLYNDYNKILNEAYTKTNNGTTITGIHTTRFNLFYLNNEAQLVAMIIKRIMLDYQPVITIEQIKPIIRNPPFDIEYNTKLISDEAITMAIHAISFSESQLRIILSDGKYDFTKSIFDSSSIVIDHDGHECRIVCIGEDVFCSNTYLVLKRTDAIIHGDKSIVSAFKRQYIDNALTDIDTNELADVLAEHISIEDIINDISDKLKNGKELKTIIDKYRVDEHIQLANWVIQSACEFATNKRKTDINLVKLLVEYYQHKKLLFVISDLRNSKVYDRFKIFDKPGSNAWWSGASKVSLSGLPVCHAVSDLISVYQFTNKTWLTLSSIADANNISYKYKWYIYDEKIPKTIDVITKIRFMDDINSRGINMQFLQKPELLEVAKILKVKYNKDSQKKNIISEIITAAYQEQKKIYPKRIIFTLIDL